MHRRMKLSRKVVNSNFLHTRSGTLSSLIPHQLKRRKSSVTLMSKMHRQHWCKCRWRIRWMSSVHLPWPSKYQSPTRVWSISMPCRTGLSFHEIHHIESPLSIGGLALLASPLTSCKQCRFARAYNRSLKLTILRACSSTSLQAKWWVNWIRRKSRSQPRRSPPRLHQIQAKSPSMNPRATCVSLLSKNQEAASSSLTRMSWNAPYLQKQLQRRTLRHQRQTWERANPILLQWKLQ